MRNEACFGYRMWRRAAAVLLALLALAPAVLAADLYRVEGVPVDATAESAVAARAAALDAGQREGLLQLLRRLTSPADHARLPSVEQLPPVEPYVHSFEIAEEKVAPTRYLAKLNVNYIPSTVQDLLRGTGLPFVTRRSEPILIVPVEITPEGPAAWLEASPWRAAWSAGIEQARVTTLALPLGDLADVAAAPPAALAAGDAAALGALAGRYGAGLAVVAAARLERDPTTSRLLRVELAVRRGDRWNEPVLTTVVEAAPEEDEAATLARAAGRVVAAVEDDWKRQTLMPAAAVSRLPVAVTLADLPTWVQIRRQLTGLPEVRELQVQSFGRTGARVNIAYVGELAQLIAAVERLGLVLAEEGDGWHLRPAGDQAVLQTPLPVAPATR